MAGHLRVTRLDLEPIEVAVKTYDHDDTISLEVGETTYYLSFRDAVAIGMDLVEAARTLPR